VGVVGGGAGGWWVGWECGGWGWAGEEGGGGALLRSKGPQEQERGSLRLATLRKGWGIRREVARGWFGDGRRMKLEN